MSGVLTISRVELVRFLRERSNIFFVFILPLALVVFIGLQFGDGQSTSLGVVSNDDAAANELIEYLDESDGVSIMTVSDSDELLSMVSRGNLGGGIVIEPGYEQALRSGEPFEVGFVGRPDAAAQSLQTVVEAAVSEQAALSRAARTAADATDQPFDGLVEVAAQVRDQMPGVTVTMEAVGGDDLAQEFAGLGQFDLGASSQLFLFVFLTSLAGSAALIQTRQYGIATRMLSTPTRLPVILTGLAGGRLVIALFQALYIIAITAVIFNVNWGDPLATSVLVLLFCIVSAAAGMVVGSVFRNDSQASGAGIGLGLVLAALGGSMVPLDVFPEGMRTISRFTPHAWANEAMAELVRRDGGIGDIVTELAALSAFAVGLLVLATVLLRRVLTR